MSAHRHRIVVVGGGVGGLTFVTHLARRLGRTGRADIVLADQALAHIWKPMLHRFASGTADYHAESLPFAVHARRHRYRYIPGRLAALDRDAQTVTLDPVPLDGSPVSLGGATLDYDTLVLAVGSQSDDFGCPGVTEHCHVIEDHRSAQRFGDAFRIAVARALSERRDVRVAIVGGGATGVELAAELSRARDTFAAYLPRGSMQAMRIVLIDSGQRLLGALPPRVSSAAQARLAGLGIKIINQAKVEGAEPTGFLLAGGDRVDADILVWTAGIRAPEILQGLDGLETSPQGRLVVCSTLQTSADPAIFGLGDCTSLGHGRASSVPATAQAARQQAIFLARSIGRQLKFGRPLSSFRFRDFGSIVSLGGYTAYGTLGRHGLFPATFIEGSIAQLADVVLYRAHQLELNGVIRGSALWLSNDLRRLVKPAARLD